MSVASVSAPDTRKGKQRDAGKVITLPIVACWVFLLKALIAVLGQALQQPFGEGLDVDIHLPRDGDVSFAKRDIH